ncbi:MAG TPA: carbohydrate-binding protein [Polyangia bacterium]|nr:carbohydrate-binding protein [Polyangia bacterium]
MALVGVCAVLPLLSCASEDVVDDNSQGQSSALGSFNVLTRNYNNQRTGANLSETTLTPSNVTSGQFGKLFALSVDDQVLAGVLYGSNVSIAGGTHNVVWVATANNTVYAFDADKAGNPLWKTNFNNGGRPTNNHDVGQGACGGNYVDFIGNIGIVSTPVIDSSTNTIYFVTRAVNGGTTQQLHAVDITTGAERHSPQTISFAGFNSTTNNQRPALALSSGVVYVAWSSFCDDGSYHGLVAGFDAASLSLVGSMNATPSGSQAGIWMGGAGPAFDSAGNLFVATGNGTWDGSNNFGESLLKLAPRTLARSSFFTAGNWANLNAGDVDLGSCGPIMLPGTSSVVTGSKEGKIYLMPTGNLGGENNSDSQIPQWFQAVNTSIVNSTHHIHNSPVAWQSPAGLNLYVWGENDFLRGFRFNPSTGKFGTSPFASGANLPPVGMPGGMMTISANNSNGGSAILWATTPLSGDANHATVPGILRAYNAENLSLLWDSNTSANNTQTFAKFNPPVVANGKVYVPSFSNMVSVYGLLPPQAPSTPFTTLNIPGTIEAEDFDNGGEGVAYHDADPTNQGGAFRPNEGVDVQASPNEGAFDVGWINAGEWLKYTANIAPAGGGMFNLSARVASSGGGGTFRVEVDGTDVTGPITVSNTGSWTTWTTVTRNGISLPGGQHVLRVFIISLASNNVAFNLNSFTFQSTNGGGGTGGSGGGTGGTSGSTPFAGTPASLPGTVQAENFDEGGEGVAYHDTDNVDMGPVTNRVAGSPGVDLENTTDTGGGSNVGWIDTGEWLMYSVNVTTAATHTASFRVASMVGGGNLHLEVDGARVGGSVSIANTGGWQTWINATLPNVNLTAGSHRLRVFFDTGGLNLNSFRWQ